MESYDEYYGMALHKGYESSRDSSSNNSDSSPPLVGKTNGDAWNHSYDTGYPQHYHMLQPMSAPISNRDPSANVFSSGIRRQLNQTYNLQGTPPAPAPPSDSPPLPPLPPKSKKYQDRMSQADSKLLVSLWKESYSSLKSSKARDAWSTLKTTFNSISSGPDKTVKELKAKIHNIVSAYKKARTKNNRTGEGVHTSLCYEEIDSVLGSRHQITLPEVKERGVDDDEEGMEDDENNDDKEGSESENDDDEEDDGDANKDGTSGAYIAELQKEKDEVTKKSDKNEKRKAPRRASKADVVERQLAAFKESEERHYKFMKEMMEAQQAIEKEERKDERDFFLKLAEVFKQ